MRCPSCGQDNPTEARFCMACAAALGRVCPACGTEAPTEARFCMACAAPLEAPGAAHPDAAPAPVPPAPTWAQPAPASFAGGRYRVRQAIGEGGKKRVYLAHDAVLDRDVALAVIKTEGLDDESRSRVTREAQAMGRLGDHPHILQIHDLGEENPSAGSGQAPQPYMVLPLMSGGDVETLITNAPEHRLELERATDIARQVCRGLDFAHSQGIVHRDLKPGNVWLAADGTAKIGDFGLAVMIDRSRLTQEGMMVGTVSYMPPEQAVGGEVTERADLYSLGAMLYEMVTGRPPFLGDDSVGIIGQHINTPPVAPTWHNPSCPRPLEALILRLLSKDPAERPASAADVLAALEGIDLSAGGEAPDGSKEANVLDSLAGGVFVGRQREMGELKVALEDALSGRGRMVTLVGEPGIGKTRTATELATYAGLRGAQVLWGRCYEEHGVPPYWPWVQAIRSYVREHEPEQLRSEMGTGAADIADIAEIVSDVRERIPDLKPSPALDDPEQARFRLFDSITAFLKGASRTQPIVLVLDDLHWADKPSPMLLQFLVRELAGARLLLVGTYRDVELSRQHPLAETLGELTRESGSGFQRVVLRGLTAEDVGRFIEVTSGTPAPRGLVDAVHSQTEGNPLFVTEVVRLLAQEGELAPRPAPVQGRPSTERAGVTESLRQDSGQAWTVRIPEGVREVIGRRLNRLSERCNDTLTVAAVIGREFELRQLARLIDDISDDRLLVVLEEALSARVIEEMPAAFELFLRADDRDLAVAAASFAFWFTGSDYGASPVIDRAIELTEPRSLEEGVLRARQGMGRFIELQDYDGARESLGRAIEIAESHGDLRLKARTYVHLTQMHSALDDPENAVEYGFEAIRLSRRADPPSEARMSRLLGGSLMALGRPREALEVAESSLEIGRGLRNPVPVFLALLPRLQASLLTGEWEMARRAVADMADAAPTYSWVESYRAVEAVLTGAPVDVVEQLTEALDSFDPRDAVGVQAMVWTATAAVTAARLTGSMDLVNRAEAALRLFLESRDRQLWGVGNAIGVLGLAAAVRNDAAAASELYRQLSARAARADNASGLAKDRVLGLLAQTMGNLDDAAAHFEDALAFCREAGYRPELAWSCCDYADMLRDPSTSSGRAAEENQEKATQLLDESLAISRELGMRPLMERVLSRREILGA